ncbi:kinase-like protein, partial [Dentipellis sp. KUC8613]
MVYSKHAEERPSLVGQIVDGGALLLLETLGAGAYGTVYRALELHSDNGTQRAVKVLEKPRLDRRTAKFHARELQLHTLVSGLPGILPLHRHFEDEHHIFVVLALVAGGDLHARITQGHVFWRNDELVRDALLQLTDALGACHARGVYHRDVKPENILCSADGRTLWLADFGLASVDQVSTSHGCGSGHYMAPEVIGREFAGRTPYLTRGADVWALGVVLVNIVAGRSPWRRALLRDPGFEHFVDDPDYLRTVLPISEACNELVNRACCIDPLERISMREFREEILKVDTFFMSEEELEEA